MITLAAEIITGQGESHLTALADGDLHRLHAGVVGPFRNLQRAASVAGFDLQIASSFRSFERQLAIWNAKALGMRPVMDDNGQPLDMANLSDHEKVFAILRWSALPGASRHHWGTDMDVWDPSAVTAGYNLQLVPEEYGIGGPFYGLSQWLDENSSRFGFCRPYAEDCGGVAPEAWHLSYLPIAREFERQLTPDLLRQVLENSEIELKPAVLDSLDEICTRFVHTVND